ncbi:MAG: tRNA-modifying protein YgfZ [Steroidobacteraceae bacterium]|nr:tRNA-modifying protein YgfZ [Steroidobacteraceae bacterium]
MRGHDAGTVNPFHGQCRLADLGVLTARGRDAVPFLQGQLSQDVTRLDAHAWRYAGYHNPQGRVIAVLRLVPAVDGVHCVLPRELVAAVAARLRRYVLRAKVTLADDSEVLQVIGAVHEDRRRELRIEPAPGGAVDDAALAARAAWRALDIAAGLPQVYPATSEVFVAQMLNLDLVGGIAFDKGCYTGQEIVARAHYRGRVKRRMQRFRAATGSRTALVPGSTGRLADGRAFQVVDAVALADGDTEFLAVAPLTAADPAAPGELAQDAPREPAATPVEARSLPLPYALPD